MKDSWGAPFVRVVVGRVDVDGEAIFGLCFVILYGWYWFRIQMVMLRRMEKVGSLCVDDGG